MAAGRPVVCLDLGGPGVQVTVKTGIKVKPSNPENVVADLAKAVLRLAEDAELSFRMGEASRKRIKEDFDWDSKGDLIGAIYKMAVPNSDPEHAKPPRDFSLVSTDINRSS